MVTVRLKLNPAVPGSSSISRPPDETLGRQLRPGNEAVVFEIFIVHFLLPWVDDVVTMTQNRVTGKSQNYFGREISVLLPDNELIKGTFAANSINDFSGHSGLLRQKYHGAFPFFHELT